MLNSILLGKGQMKNMDVYTKPLQVMSWKSYRTYGTLYVTFFWFIIL
jgi:hypothetical protein